jgi:hypothetical protein
MSALSREVKAHRRPGGPQPENDHEAQLVELRGLVVSMRNALEQAQATADAELQVAREVYQAEIRQLKAAVTAGRDSFEEFQQRSSGEAARAVSTALAEVAQLRETIQAM